MAVFRINKTSDYTIMCNHHLRNKKISLKAAGLLSKMLSLPDDWDYSVKGLVSICKENETSIRAALNELKESGYLTVDKLTPDKTKTGRIEYIYNIYEQPQGIEKQEVENLPLEKQQVEFQEVENQGQLNTNKLNIKELNTQKIKYIVEYLNQQAGTNYRSTTKDTQLCISERLNDGFNLDDFKKVIDKKCNEWLNSDMSKYLRPSTLFGDKFESYLNQPIKQCYCEY